MTYPRIYIWSGGPYSGRLTHNHTTFQFVVGNWRGRYVNEVWEPAQA